MLWSFDITARKCWFVAGTVLKLILCNKYFKPLLFYRSTLCSYVWYLILSQVKEYPQFLVLLVCFNVFLSECCLFVSLCVFTVFILCVYSLCVLSVYRFAWHEFNANFFIAEYEEPIRQIQGSNMWDIRSKFLEHLFSHRNPTGQFINLCP